MEQSFGRTIQLFLVDGTPNGLRKATIHGWTGLTFVATASTFSAMTARTELDRTGIYILHGPDPAQANGFRAYIGSANSVTERIKQSAAQRGFWETAVAITTSDDDLSKGHVEYLEARLIEMASKAQRVTLDNGNQPTGQRRRLPEADRANMEQFLLNIQTILPVIGIEILKPQPKAALLHGQIAAQLSPSETVFEIRHKSGVSAEAVEDQGEFVVLEGSQALKAPGYSSQNYATLKQSLLDKSVLIEESSLMYRFAKSYAFSSPSAAAAVILDRNSNGRTEWKVKGSKMTYQDWKDANAPHVSGEGVEKELA